MVRFFFVQWTFSVFAREFSSALCCKAVACGPASYCRPVGLVVSFLDISHLFSLFSCPILSWQDPDYRLDDNSSVGSSTPSPNIGSRGSSRSPNVGSCGASSTGGSSESLQSSEVADGFSRSQPRAAGSSRGCSPSQDDIPEKMFHLSAGTVTFLKKFRSEKHAMFICLEIVINFLFDEGQHVLKFCTSFGVVSDENKLPIMKFCHLEHFPPEAKNDVTVFVFSCVPGERQRLLAEVSVCSLLFCTLLGVAWKSNVS